MVFSKFPIGSPVRIFRFAARLYLIIMNIAVIGASAGVGLETVKSGLARHHTVITLSRSAVPLPAYPRLKTIKGSALHKQDLRLIVDMSDAVIVTLGTGTSRAATTLYSDFAKVLIEVYKETDRSIPFILLTGFGAGESENYYSLPMRSLLRLLLKEVYADKTRMEKMIGSSDLPWIIVRPGRLRDRPFTGRYRIETHLYKGINIGAINRADVADFMLNQAEQPTALNTYVSLSGS